MSSLYKVPNIFELVSLRQASIVPMYRRKMEREMLLIRPE